MTINTDYTYTLMDTKRVKDSDGFWTDYTWYLRDDGTHVFMFGDIDLYLPEEGYYDWEVDSEEEAEDWFFWYDLDIEDE